MTNKNNVPQPAAPTEDVQTKTKAAYMALSGASMETLHKSQEDENHELQNQVVIRVSLMHLAILIKTSNALSCNS